MARQAGRTVIEVHRSDKVERRRIGKSDPIDAYAAARADVSGRVRLPAPGRRLMTRRHGRRRARIAFSDSATKQLENLTSEAESTLWSAPSPCSGRARPGLTQRAPRSSRSMVCAAVSAATSLPISA